MHILFSPPELFASPISAPVIQSLQHSYSCEASCSAELFMRAMTAQVSGRTHSVQQWLNSRQKHEVFPTVSLRLHGKCPGI